MNLLLMKSITVALVASVGAHAIDEVPTSNLRSASDRTLVQATGTNASGTNTIKCKYVSSWPSTLTASQACTNLNDPVYPVPYKCPTTGQKLCCTVSSIINPTFGSFGQCSKVVSQSSDGTTKSPTRKPTKSPVMATTPTKKPSPKPVTVSNYIDCEWYPWYAEYNTPALACKALNDPVHPVPYLCEDGRKTCCTVSTNTSPTFEKFGTCNKV